MDLSIIIVSWNVKDLLRECLNSILDNRGDLQLEIFVVDNASSDGSAEMVKQEFRDKVILIANLENLGFSKANNQAIKISRGRYVLLLNPDMRVLPDTLPQMVKFMDEHKEAGVAGCHLIDVGGKTVPHTRRFPTILDQAVIVLKLPHVFPTILNKYLMKDFGYDRGEAAEVDSIRGSFFMIRRRVIEKIGGLDERYFIWFEEVDYCRSVIKAGWKIMYNPAVKCIDHVGQSFQKRDSLWKQKNFTKSMLQYFQKWEPWYKWIWIWFARRIVLPAFWLGDKIKK
ncbi:MAG: glycosyltransferase family 2 protein [Candidatus Magasanikbacteria bacterium]|nr:glycosyltransferase family 2 protein [Candidatus Magasanikbacteria bacterium]